MVHFDPDTGLRIFSYVISVPLLLSMMIYLIMKVVTTRVRD